MLADILPQRNGLDALYILGIGASLMILLFMKIDRQNRPGEDPRARARALGLQVLEGGITGVLKATSRAQLRRDPRWSARLAGGVRRFQAVRLLKMEEPLDPVETLEPAEMSMETTQLLSRDLAHYLPHDWRAAAGGAATGNLTRPLGEIGPEDARDAGL